MGVTRGSREMNNAIHVKTGIQNAGGFKRDVCILRLMSEIVSVMHICGEPLRFQYCGLYYQGKWIRDGAQ